MSRIGSKPIPVPKGVDVTIEPRKVKVKGPKGTLEQEITGAIAVEFDKPGARVLVKRASEEREDRAKHGLYRALIANMVTGVTHGFEKKLELHGKDYSVKLQGRKLLLSVGYNSQEPEVFDIPQGISIATAPTTSKEITDIVVQGIDKQLVGQVAATIRHIRTPDPYHGKGLRYKDEKVRKLPGKQLATGAATGS